MNISLKYFSLLLIIVAALTQSVFAQDYTKPPLDHERDWIVDARDVKIKISKGRIRSDKITILIYKEKIKSFSVDERNLSSIVSALSGKLSQARKQNRMLRVRYNVIHSPRMGDFFHNTLWLKDVFEIE